MTDETDDDETTYDPEIGLPVHAPDVDCDCDWHPTEIYARMWYAGELHDALTNHGWTPTRENFANPDYPLTRNHYWVSPDGASKLRLTDDPKRLVSPYLAACVVALMAE